MNRPVPPARLAVDCIHDNKLNRALITAENVSRN